MKTILIILLTAVSGFGQVQSGGITGTAGSVSSFPGGGLFLGGINAQSGTSYAFVVTDENKLTTFNNGASVAVTLSQATTTGFTSGATFYTFNRGAGTVTITPATSTINGAATLVLVQNQGAMIISDGTNYSTWVSTAGTGSVTSIATTAPLGGGTITTSGTLTCTTCLTGTPTNHGVAVGSATQATNYTAAGTTGQVLTSNGASSDPTYQASSGGGIDGWSGTPLTFAVTTTQFAAPTGGALTSATETVVSLAAPATATYANLSVSVSAALGASATLAVTLENGTATPSALTCTTASGGTTCVDNTHTVNVTKGALISFKLVSSGSVSAGIPQVEIGFTVGIPATTTGANGTFWVTNAAGATVSTVNYFGPMSGTGSGTESTKEWTAPVACTASNLMIRMTGTESTGNLTITLRRGTTPNNAIADTALTVNVANGSGANTDWQDVTHTVAINALDRLSWSVVNSTGTSGAFSNIAMQCN